MKVEKKYIGKRIDLVIMGMKPSFSRRTIKRLIEANLIKVNGKSPFANYKVKAEDEIEILDTNIDKYIKHSRSSLVLVPNHHIKLDILYQDDYTIIVNKQAGIATHPSNAKDISSLLNALYARVSNVGMEDFRIRVVNRLDKDTSGIVLATKNIKANEFYSEQFEKRTVQKTYYAIVKGDFESFSRKHQKDIITIRTYIGPDKNNPKKQANTSPKKGKIAISDVAFVSHFKKFGKNKFSLVQIKPKTGRTHQIRVHLSSIGFPILGDSIYEGQKYKRLMLHASNLEFLLYPSGKLSEVESDLPVEFDDIEDTSSENEFTQQDTINYEPDQSYS